jgi:hypothetical protein
MLSAQKERTVEYPNAPVTEIAGKINARRLMPVQSVAILRASAFRVRIRSQEYTPNKVEARRQQSEKPITNKRFFTVIRNARNSSKPAGARRRLVARNTETSNTTARGVSIIRHIDR